MTLDEALQLYDRELDVDDMIDDWETANEAAWVLADEVRALQAELHWLGQHGC